MERQRLSVGFADMMGFARAAETTSDEAILATLQQAYASAGDAIVAHGGRINKYIGDAVMFVVPDPAGAARAASAVADTGPFVLGEAELRYRVAVATGEVVAGRIGHPSLEQEDVFGHTVHRAARLLAEAGRSPGRVTLDEAT